MPDQTLETGTRWIFCDDSGDYGPTAANDISGGSGAGDQYQLTLGSVADNTARQGVQVDLGANRPPKLSPQMVVDLSSAPTAGDRIRVFVGFTENSTPANGNPGGLSGSDAAYTYSAELLESLTPVGSLSCESASGIQVVTMPLVVVEKRFMMPVVINEAGVALATSDVQMALVFSSVIPDMAAT